MPDIVSPLGPLTEAGVPLSLRPFFQDYRLENIDPVRDSFTLIERTLAWGSRVELRWLFTHYPQEHGGT
ncbi:MAG: hypothetical protein ACE5FI_06205 [Anaerolineales bacterium]